MHTCDRHASEHTGTTDRSGDNGAHLATRIQSLRSNLAGAYFVPRCRIEGLHRVLSKATAGSIQLACADMAISRADRGVRFHDMERYVQDEPSDSENPLTIGAGAGVAVTAA